MKNELIIKTEEFLRDNFNKSKFFLENPTSMEYRLQHSYRVANIGKIIAEKEGFNVTEMIIGCLLHDISYCNNFNCKNDWLNHGRNSAKIARPFLQSLGLTNDRIDDICYGIAIHVDDKADFEGIRTPFAETIGDADNLDRFDAYRIYENLESSKFSKMCFNEKENKVINTLNKLKMLKKNKFGTTTSTELWNQRLDFYITFYEKLNEQMSNSCKIL